MTRNINLLFFSIFFFLLLPSAVLAETSPKLEKQLVIRLLDGNATMERSVRSIVVYYIFYINKESKDFTKGRMLQLLKNKDSEFVESQWGSYSSKDAFRKLKIKWEDSEEVEEAKLIYAKNRTQLTYSITAHTDKSQLGQSFQSRIVKVSNLPAWVSSELKN